MLQNVGPVFGVNLDGQSCWIDLRLRHPVGAGVIQLCLSTTGKLDDFERAQFGDLIANKFDDLARRIVRRAVSSERKLLLRIWGRYAIPHWICHDLDAERGVFRVRIGQAFGQEPDLEACESQRRVVAPAAAPQFLRKPEFVKNGVPERRPPATSRVRLLACVYAAYEAIRSKAGRSAK